MANKHKKKTNKKNGSGKRNDKKNAKLLPFVSVCTPTFNRRPFIPAMIKCFERQLVQKTEWSGLLLTMEQIRSKTWENDTHSSSALFQV